MNKRELKRFEDYINKNSDLNNENEVIYARNRVLTAQKTNLQQENERLRDNNERMDCEMCALLKQLHEIEQPLKGEMLVALRNAQPAVDITYPLYEIPDDVARAIVALIEYPTEDEGRDAMSVRIMAALYMPVYPWEETP